MVASEAVCHVSGFDGIVTRIALQFLVYRKKDLRLVSVLVSHSGSLVSHGNVLWLIVKTSIVCVGACCKTRRCRFNNCV